MKRLTVLAAALLSATAASAAPPAAFLKDAIQGNYSEVTLGRMIQNRGASAEVKDFGAMLVSDHSKGLSQAQQIADRMHLHIAATLTPEARHEQTVLRKLHGASFYREVRRYMIEDHRKDIAKFSAQAKSGDRATARYAAATVPVMRHHLSMAESLRR
jgi:putative membrane protein